MKEFIYLIFQPVIMNKYTLLKVFVLITALTSSCQKKANTGIPNDDLNSLIGELVQSFDLNEETTLQLFKNEIENTLILQTKWKNEIISIAGCGNCEYVTDDNGLIKIKKLHFSDNQKVFLITAYVRGSTYGAENYFLAYGNKHWFLNQLPFDRADFYDADEDSFDEIIEYKPESDSTIYTFQKGILIVKD